MVRYSEEILDEIRNKIDIVALISEYVSLKKSGKNYKGLCPFHQEKTPSFMVNRERQIFHCFGCGEGGNIFSFLMKIEKLNFPEAVKLLANKAGVQLPVYEQHTVKERSERELIYRLNTIAANYYQQNLFLPQGEKALNYLIKRKFKRDTIKKFSLGYALPGSTHLINIFLSKKIEYQAIVKAGLATRSSKSGKIIDYFYDRIIFPIFNLQGKIIAFGGRVLDDKLPKYINTPETLLYNKARNLYGLYQAKKSILQKNQVIIVEGYTDLLMAHQNGFENVVASLGTSLTEQQINLLKRFTDEIIIAFDSDTAGKNATLRSLSMVKKAGMKVRIILLPENCDPADIISQKGNTFFADLIERALPLIDYKLQVLLQKYNLTHSQSKIAIIRELLTDLIDITSDVEMRIEVHKIAEKLDLSEESILRDLNRYKKGDKKLSNIISDTQVESTYVNAEKILIGALLYNKENIEKIASEIKIEDFSVPEHQEIFSVIINLYKNREVVSLQKVLDKIERPEMINLVSRIILRDVISCDENAIDRSIKAVKTHRFKLELEKIKRAINEEEKRNKEVSPELLQEYQNILHKIKTMI